MAEQEMQLWTQAELGFLKQNAFDVIQANDANFHYFAMTNCDFGPVQGAGALPPETGATAFTRGYFKTGVAAAGGMDIVPRLENRIGWLLEAACGDSSSYLAQTIDQVIAGAGATGGVNTHLFGLMDGNEFYIPYLTVHRRLPHDTAANRLGEIFQDCRIMGLRIDAVPAGVVRMRADMIGRAKASTTWDKAHTWGPRTYDADGTFMVTSCSGYVELNVTGGTPAAPTRFDVGATTVALVNNLLPPDQTRRIGSPHPKDFPNLSRALTLTTIIYIEDYDVYEQAFAGAMAPVVDGLWSCDALEGNFDIELASQEQIGATGEEYKMRILTLAGNVKWNVAPLRITPNQPVLLQLFGTVTNPSSGLPFYIYIQNGQLSY